MIKNGCEPITVSMECDIVDILNFCVAQRDITRSAAVREAIKDWISKELAKRPEFWERAAYGVRNRSDSKSIV